VMKLNRCLRWPILKKMIERKPRREEQIEALKAYTVVVQGINKRQEPKLREGYSVPSLTVNDLTPTYKADLSPKSEKGVMLV